MKSESEVQQLIQIEAAKHGCMLLRNNSGAFKDASGRMVRFGLGSVSKTHDEHMKSSDLIGMTKCGIFIAVECKSEDWRPLKKLDKREQAQANFIAWVISHGGIGGFCNSVESFLELMGKE